MYCSSCIGKDWTKCVTPGQVSTGSSGVKNIVMLTQIFTCKIIDA